ncbi:hypothetical protein CHKEEEPN_3255 [Methylorubrum podarium]|jgi:transposase|nr:hypothetical protein CHKEEEPN_3255 [Methylorubrum podarium]
MRASAHPLREVFDGLRHVVKTGAPWRWMPHDLPLWAAVYQQAQRWLSAGCFEQLAEDLRAVLRLAAGREAEPSTAILDRQGDAGSIAAFPRKKFTAFRWAADIPLLAPQTLPTTIAGVRSGVTET